MSHSAYGASRRHTDHSSSLEPHLLQRLPPNVDDIVNQYSEWVEKIHGPTGRHAIAAQLESLFAFQGPVGVEAEEPLAFSGRIDVRSHLEDALTTDGPTRCLSGKRCDLAPDCDFARGTAPL